MNTKIAHALHAARLVLENPSTEQAKADALSMVNATLDDGGEAAQSSTRENRLYDAVCAGNEGCEIKVRCQSYEASEQSKPCPAGRCVMAAEDAGESAAQEAWRPIADAPKDRNIILTDGREVSEGGWMTDVEQGAEYEGQAGMAGWWSLASLEKPTHWQPLPTPPDSRQGPK